MTIKVEDLLKAAQKSTNWLYSRQTEKGNYVGLEQPDENGIYPDTDDLGCYYKSVYCLRIAGQSVAAARGFKHVIERFMTPEGDFMNSPEVRSSGSYAPNYCQLYPNQWLYRAAVAFRWYGLTQKILSFMLKYRDPETGGFYATVNPPTEVIDSNATGLGALCCMLGDRLDLALQSIEQVIKMFEAQPDPTKLYTRWEEGKGLLTEIPDDLPDKKKKFWYIDAKKPEQAYWMWGWPMNGLIGLYDRLGEERYLKYAIRIYDFFAAAHPHAFGYVTAGKCGWGSSMLHRITGDKRYLKTALSQMNFILSSQHKEGYMLGPGAKGLEDQPIRTTYDYTADFSTWLVDASVELAGRM